MLAWSLGGGRYDLMTDSWRSISEIGAPEARIDHVMVWTGNEMVVWGGWLPSNPAFSSGGRYDPITDTWEPTSMVNAPPGRVDSVAIWTGKEALFTGGDWFCPTSDPGCHDSIYASGARYDPASDSWRPMAVFVSPTQTRSFSRGVATRRFGPGTR